MKCSRLILIIFTFQAILGCTSSGKRVGAIEVISDKVGFAFVDIKNISVGDEVNVYKHGCWQPSPKRNFRDTRTVWCRDDLIGKAKIRDISDREYARVELIGEGIYQGKNLFIAKETDEESKGRLERARRESCWRNPKFYIYEYPTKSVCNFQQSSQNCRHE